VADLADYLELTVSEARQQFRALVQRRPVSTGRQVTFLPVETLLPVNGGLRIHLAPPLAHAVQIDPLTRQYYGRPPLREAILLPTGAQEPARKYLDWHLQNVFNP
jgi:hypothetical protein